MNKQYTTGLTCDKCKMLTGIHFENTNQTLCFCCHNKISPDNLSLAAIYISRPIFYSQEPDYKSYERESIKGLPLVIKPTKTVIKKEEKVNVEEQLEIICKVKYADDPEQYNEDFYKWNEELS